MAGNIRPSGDGYLVGTFPAFTAVARGEIVVFRDNNSVEGAAATGQIPIGVALEAAGAGEICTVVRGYCLVLAGAAIAVSPGSGEISTDSAGKAVASGDFSSTAGYVLGTALSDAAAADDLFPAFVAPYLSTADHS
jgi:hypothetical protein